MGLVILKWLNVIVVIIFLISPNLNAQFIVNIGVGGTGYQGDISVYSNRVSFTANNKLAYHMQMGLELNNYLSFKLGYLSGELRGNDNKSEDRKYRNLSFFTDIKELSLTGELNVLEFMNLNYRDSRIHPFVKFGLAVFHFNPKTKMKGSIIELQPLGTEGQGLSQYPERKKYSLYQISIPFGVGVKYDIDDRFSIMAQLSPRWTFTDYIDDVSESYPDFEMLQEERGEMAVLLSDRSKEIFGDRKYTTGDARGNPSEKDWYFYLGLDMSYRFDMRRVIGIFNKDYRMVSCKTY